jgi:hypothetical protein
MREFGTRETVLHNKATAADVRRCLQVCRRWCFRRCGGGRGNLASLMSLQTKAAAAPQMQHLVAIMELFGSWTLLEAPDWMLGAKVFVPAAVDAYAILAGSQIAIVAASDDRPEGPESSRRC